MRGVFFVIFLFVGCGSQFMNDVTDSHYAQSARESVNRETHTNIASKVIVYETNSIHSFCKRQVGSCIIHKSAFIDDKLSTVDRCYSAAHEMMHYVVYALTGDYDYDHKTSYFNLNIYSECEDR